VEILKVITPDDGRTSRAPANEEKASMRCPLRDLARPLEPGEPDPLVSRLTIPDLPRPTLATGGRRPDQCCS